MLYFKHIDIKAMIKRSKIEVALREKDS